MSYWNRNEYKQTREKENPVSKWWGKKYPSKSSWSYIKSLIRYFFSTKINPDDIDTNDSSFIADL